MTQPGSPPTPTRVASWIGPGGYRRWKKLVQSIEMNYPGVFKPEWLFGGKKYGWSLRFKKSRSFCTLVPERKNFSVLIVFGAEERDKAQEILPELTRDVQDAYRDARTYHDGKWLFLPCERDVVLGDIMKLLAVKRRPAAVNAHRIKYSMRGHAG